MARRKSHLSEAALDELKQAEKATKRSLDAGSQALWKRAEGETGR